MQPPNRVATSESDCKLRTAPNAICKHRNAPHCPNPISKLEPRSSLRTPISDLRATSRASVCKSDLKNIFDDFQKVELDLGCQTFFHVWFQGQSGATEHDLGFCKMYVLDLHGKSVRRSPIFGKLRPVSDIRFGDLAIGTQFANSDIQFASCSSCNRRHPIRELPIVLIICKSSRNLHSPLTTKCTITPSSVTTNQVHLRAECDNFVTICDKV
jgi:hypothetical protein